MSIKDIRMKRKAIWAAVGMIPILIAANYMPRLVLYIFYGMLIFALMIVGWFRYRNKCIKTFFLLVSAAIAISSFFMQYQIYERPISLYESKKITAQVVLVENNSGYWRATVKNAEYNGQAIPLYGETYIPMYGYQVRAFDVADVEFVLHRAGLGEYGTFLADDVSILKVSSPEYKSLGQHLSEFRENIITLLQVRIGGEEGQLVASILTGESGALSLNTRLNFSRTGLTHIMAVSGLHLSTLNGMVIYLLSRANVNWRIANIISLLFVGLVVVLGGFSMSVLRAAAMNIIMVLGRLVGREADPLNSLGVAMIVIGLIFPFQVVDPSYLLSGAATLGILVLSPILEQFIRSRVMLSRRQSKQLSLICVSISSGIFTAPILILFFGEISILSVPAMSIVNYPVVFILMGAAIFCCLFWVPFLGDFIAFLVRIAAQLVLELVELLASFDQATISVRSLPMILIFTLGALTVLLWFILKNRIKMRNILTGSLGGILVVLICMVPFYPFLSSRLTTLHDGTSIYINHGKAIVVNCSSRYAANQVRREVSRRGFDKIDVLIVTDFDEDISGGISTLLSYISVKQVIMPDCDLYSDACREIVEAAQRTNAALVSMDTDSRVCINGIELNFYMLEEKSFLLKLTDGENSIGFWSVVNDETVTQSLRYPLGELQVDVLSIGPKTAKGSIDAKLLYVTRPNVVFMPLLRRELTLEEKLDIAESNVQLCKFTSSQSKIVYDYRKEKTWIYRNSNYN